VRPKSDEENGHDESESADEPNGHHEPEPEPERIDLMSVPAEDLAQAELF
jgi:hypothetical protein